ncbi:MAG: hypothetical protein Q9P01_01425 [Anaerolineae bacterium]|nr:hypothetical protein [Anaerolineae bacterium]
MAEPPLSNDELRMYAGKVIIGKVTSVSREEVEVEMAQIESILSKSIPSAKKAVLDSI